MKKRVYFSSALFILFFIALVGRISYISLGNSYNVSAEYNSYSLLLDSVEPNIYYKNYEKLTNNIYEQYALLKPNVKTLAELSYYFENPDEVAQELKQGKPVLKKVNKTLNGYIETYNVKSTENNCSQLLSRESGGLLSYLPDSVGKRKLRFYVDAKGRMLTGSKIEQIDNNYVTSEGLLLTLDSEIQNITYDACENIKSGCAVVMDIASSEILACVTKPDGSYLNKPVMQYAAGSVFKLVIAACALENGLNPLYDCGGKIKVGDTEYSCQKLHKHGKQHIKEALANSCNCYFVNLAMKLGSKNIIKTAKKLGFDENINLYKDWKAKSAVLPSEIDLNNGDLPLIGFGQGKLTVTPLSMCSFLCTVGSSGVKSDIKLVNAEVDMFGNRTFLDYNSPKRVMTDKTAYLLLNYMRGVTENGTGKNADYNNESAGKTATAQTGQFVNSRELLNTWFAGIYPYSKPRYAIVVMTEDGKSGAEDCCPVFRTIVEKLTKL